MKYVNEFRDPRIANHRLEEIRKTIRHSWTVMEVCGGQTHTLVRSGILQLLPENITVIHGPGCPICVTPLEAIDRAIAIAMDPSVIFCSFGDMLRVPGSNTDLIRVRAAGGNVQTVYSPLDAVQIALKNPAKEVVFFAVGFETTAPATAMAVLQAHRLGVKNFSVLVTHVLVAPAMETILKAPDRRVQGFLAAGHVCTVMGFEDLRTLTEQYQIPIVVTGFEPIDLLEGLLMLVSQLERGRCEIENQYRRSVRPAGNRDAQRIIHEVYQVCHRTWRGLGELPHSGLELRDPYRAFDATRRFAFPLPVCVEPEECCAGAVLQGTIKPPQCKAFGTKCTPEHPLGAPMVSSEGACAAYWSYQRMSP
jgi:hydrogenase expression/formation protein HypD